MLQYFKTPFKLMPYGRSFEHLPVHVGQDEKMHWGVCFVVLGPPCK